MDWISKPRVISVIVDNDSWILPYAGDLVDKINASGDSATLCRSCDEITNGLVAFYLGCVNITPKTILKKNTYNLVVHESDLPKGKGFAPLTWQILEGKNTIPVCLIEASNVVDSGNIYFQKELVFQGHELNEELRHAQGNITIELCIEFLECNIPPQGHEQNGETDFYKRRYPADSELDVDKTIAKQFNILRVVDNERYPAFFKYKNQTYKLTIEKCNLEK